MNLHVQIVTPTGEVLNTQANEATATGLLGEFGILPGHLPYLSALKIGPCKITTQEETHYFALGEGFADIENDRIVLFVESAEEAHKIDVDRAQESLQRAEKRLKEFTVPIDDPGYLRADCSRQRALNRIEIAKHAGNRN